MRIGIYGAGYLGTVVAACLADFGTPVLAYDDDTARVLSLAEGNIPFYEKNLKDVIRRNLRSGRMSHSTELEPFARRSQVIYFAADSSRSNTRGLMFGPRYSTGPPPTFASPSCFFSLPGVSDAWVTSTATPTVG